MWGIFIKSKLNQQDTIYLHYCNKSKGRTILVFLNNITLIINKCYNLIIPYHFARDSLALMTYKTMNGSYCCLAMDYHPRTQGPSRITVPGLDTVEPNCIEWYNDIRTGVRYCYALKWCATIYINIRVNRMFVLGRTNICVFKLNFFSRFPLKTPQSQRFETQIVFLSYI